MKENGKACVSDHFFKDHLFLKYPVLVNDRAEFFVKAEENRILLGDWFVSPIHPVKEGFEKWDLEISQFPNASYISNHVVTLPTETKEPQRVIDFLSQNIDALI